jgi:hypothetical protein
MAPASILDEFIPQHEGRQGNPLPLDPVSGYCINELMEMLSFSLVPFFLFFFYQFHGSCPLNLHLFNSLWTIEINQEIS